MNNEIKQDILNVLKDTIKSVKENDSFALKEISNHTIHDSSIFQDEDAISIAVVVYSLAEIFERIKYRKYKDWNVFYETIIFNLKRAEENLSIDNIDNYRDSIKHILEIINKLESNLKKYIAEVIQKARISKGSRLYEHGISIGRTAELLGIPQWELMEYTGNTGISDVNLSISKRVNERLKIARGLFK